MLRERFDLATEDVYELDEEVDYTTLFEIAGLPVAELRDAPWTSFPPQFVAERSIFSAIQATDLLVHRPYESFDATVEHFISRPPTIRIQWRSK